MSLIYIFSDKEKRYSQNFAITLVILPMCVAAVIALIGSSLAGAITLGGVFALVRFRSVPGNSKDIATVFLSMATGLACGMDAPMYAVLFGGIVGAVYFVLVRFGYASHHKQSKTLKITVPENLNYQGAFDDLFEEYTTGAVLERVKTTNLGTMFELTYSVEMKNGVNEKLFIDSLRCRNGNLNITLEIKAFDPNLSL